MRLSFVAATVIAGPLSLAAAVAPAIPRDAEAALARLDRAQKDMVARADVARVAALSAPELTINAPTGRVLSREEFLAMMRDGRIGAEAFERARERRRRASWGGPTAPSRYDDTTPTSTSGSVVVGTGSRATPASSRRGPGGAPR
ncbi:DUF4440 domain-containing protein [Sphingomonas yunnanensis]|uniref:DUF4440 domain-containing protein n=1 Tax=Sphingomonas yunnanensis TaxID=310400 RepID=UPI001CA6AE81|nr:DUF4440 domain-containing protein [Sphingomonas yunnanensis]MBY9062047.1 DUF4440 domain-containing protein [Sphingomonas yunnanensis]